MKLKNNKRIRKKRRILILIFFSITLLLFKTMEKNISLFFIKYAEGEVAKLTTYVINTSVESGLFDDLDYDDLYFITKNSNNEIEMVDYNSITVNKFLNEVTDRLQSNLLKLEAGNTDFTNQLPKKSGVLFYIPFGIITNNPLFNNMGPNIPVRLKTLGALSTNIDIRVKEYGINNSLVEMVIAIEITQEIILPTITKTIKVTNEIPVSYKIINGKIPNYYGTNGINKSSNIFSIPLE